MACIRIGAHVRAHRGAFACAFLATFLGTFFVLFRLDFLPEPKDVARAHVATTAPEVSVSGVFVEGNTFTEERVVRNVVHAVREMETGTMLPVALTIPSLRMESVVVNPASADIAALDAALLQGVVRHPGSAKLGEDGNVVIFGHSSYLPVVHNPLFKAFNGVQKLSPGATITLSSSDTVFEYQVVKVTRADARADAIPLNVSGKRLTLITCDSFRSEDDRFIVEADFVKSYPKAN